MKQQVAETLKALREGRGLSQQDVADWFNINRSSVNAWENPNKAALPEVDKLQILARRYRTTVDALLDGSALLGVTSQESHPDPTTPNDQPEYPASLTKTVRVSAVVRLLSNGDIEIPGVSEGLQVIRTDKLPRAGDYYALRIVSSDNPAFRNGTAILVNKSQDYQIDRLSLVTLTDGAMRLLAPLVNGVDSVKFERMDGTTVSILRADISSIEHVAAIDSDAS